MDTENKMTEAEQYNAGQAARRAGEARMAPDADYVSAWLHGWDSQDRMYRWESEADAEQMRIQALVGRI